MPDEHHPAGPLSQRLDDLVETLDSVAEDVRATRVQAERTNGRVDKLERDVMTVRQTLFGAETDGVDNDGGLVGWARQTRRDIRILGAVLSGLLVVVTPLLTLLMNRWLG